MRLHRSLITMKPLKRPCTNWIWPLVRATSLMQFNLRTCGSPSTIKVKHLISTYPCDFHPCFHLNHDMNGLEWRLVFPRYDDLPNHSRPKCFGEYLALNKSVQIVDIKNYDIDLTCQFLDSAYDFSHHKNMPIISRQQGGINPSRL